MMKESFRVRPRMKARGATSTCALVHVRRQPIGVQHVVERVVERPEIGIDLGENVTGESRAARRPRLPVA